MADGGNGRRNRNRAHFQPADEVGLQSGDRIEDQRGDDMRALRIEHRRLHVEVVGGGTPRCELDLATGLERTFLNDFNEPRLQRRVLFTCRHHATSPPKFDRCAIA